MDFTIRLMEESDRERVTAMMREFYASPAVMTDGSDEIFSNDITNCVNDSPYLEGYVFISGDELLGYAMAAKSFSTEFGKNCVWIEDLYIEQRHRGRGIGRAFFEFIEKKYTDVIFRLEAEEENSGAVELYKKLGYDEMPYMELKKLK